jgi:hypothetical protein
MIGGAVKERWGGDVTIDRKDFGEEIGRVNEAGKEKQGGRVVDRPSPSSSLEACRST